MSTEANTSNTLMAPKLVSKVANSGNAIECSVHTLPKPLIREFHHVFAEKYLGRGRPGEPLELLAIPTNQRSRTDLVNVGDHVEQEKDRLLNVVSGRIAKSKFGWYGGFIITMSHEFMFYYLNYFNSCSLSTLPKIFVKKSLLRDTGQIILTPARASP